MNRLYYGQFRDGQNNLYTLNIYKEGQHQAKELLLADSPVRVCYETGDNIFKELKQSSCSIDILTSQILSDLYTGKVFDIRIELLRGSDLVWEGFNTPNIYNQEWSTDLDRTTIEAIDNISCLEYLKYNASQPARLSFLQVICNILSKVPNSRMQSLISIETPLSSLYIDERDFLDETGEPMKCKEVLEHIMRFLGLQMCQWGNSYVVYDPANLQGSLTITQYSL